MAEVSINVINPFMKKIARITYNLDNFKMISKSVRSTLASIIEHIKPKTTLGKHKTFLFKGKLKTN